MRNEKLNIMASLRKIGVSPVPFNLSVQYPAVADAYAFWPPSMTPSTNPATLTLTTTGRQSGTTDA
jgi:hypothetical protein